MSNYKIREIIISEKMQPTEGGPEQFKKVYQTIGVTKEKKDDTVSQTQTEKVFDKIGDAVLFAQDYVK